MEGVVKNIAVKIEERTMYTNFKVTLMYTNIKVILMNKFQVN